MSGHHSMPKTTVTQFLLAVVGALVPVLIVAVLITGHVMNYVSEFGAPDAEKDGAAVAERLKPVGEIATAEAGAAQAGRSGEDIVKTVCFAFHGTGALAAPNIGDKSGWGPRVGKNMDALVKSGIKGLNAMPPKGGAADLSDEEFASAVAYMTK